MHLSKLFALLPLAAAVSGFIIPDGLADGFYVASIDDSGNSTITKVDVPVPSFRRGARGLGKDAADFGPLDKRDSNGATGRTLPNHDEYNSCTNGWYNYLQNGNTVGSRQIAWITTGSARLSACNYKCKLILLHDPFIVSSHNFHLYSVILLWLTGPSFSIDQTAWVPPQTVHQFNGVLDNAIGSWRTGWVYSDAYQWTFWRDLSSVQSICTNLP